MQPVSNSNFGPLIAYLVPGATVLLGISRLSPEVRSLFAVGSPDLPTLGGFLYLTIASIAVGMVVSAVRWALIDSFHSMTGLPQPQLDFYRLGTNVDAFTLLIEIHYRHYQFYANMLVASVAAYACYRYSIGMLEPLGWLDLGVAVLLVIFAATSRDTLAKYYGRSMQLLSPVPPQLRHAATKPAIRRVRPAGTTTTRPSAISHTVEVRSDR